MVKGREIGDWGSCCFRYHKMQPAWAERVVLYGRRRLDHEPPVRPWLRLEPAQDEVMSLVPDRSICFEFCARSRGDLNAQ